LVALETMPPLLVHDHQRARRLARGLAGAPGLAIDLAAVQSNMVYLTATGPTGAAQQLAAACGARGVRFNAFDAHRLRLVTHHQVDDQQVDLAITVIRQDAERLAQQARPAAS